MNTAKQHKVDKSLYNLQNRKIHKARAQLCMELDECRLLAKEISGKASLSSLSPRQRWELIEMLKAKGARVHNPPLSNAPVSLQDRPQDPLEGSAMLGSMETQERPEDIYPRRLRYWRKRFPNPRPGYASNKQLAWIQALWELDFNDGRRGSGLRGFIFRQTRNLKQGPVSDLSFLRSHHIKAVMMPLKANPKKIRKKAES